MYSSMLWYLAWFFNNWKIDPAILHCWWPHFWGISTKLKHSWVIPTVSGFNFFCRSSSYKLKSIKTGWNNLSLQNLTQEMNHYPEWYLTLDGRCWDRDRKKRFVGATAAFLKLNWKAVNQLTNCRAGNGSKAMLVGFAHSFPPTLQELPDLMWIMADGFPLCLPL